MYVRRDQLLANHPLEDAFDSTDAFVDLRSTQTLINEILSQSLQFQRPKRLPTVEAGPYDPKLPASESIAVLVYPFEVTE